MKSSLLDFRESPKLKCQCNTPRCDRALRARVDGNTKKKIKIPEIQNLGYVVPKGSPPADRELEIFDFLAVGSNEK